LFLVDIPHAAQSEIRIGYVTGINYDPTGISYKLALTNYPLGGSFNSRLNLDLREEKGWTYGAGSGFASGKFGGTFTASAGVRAASTDSAVREFVKLIGDYSKDGETSQELTFTKNSIGQADALKYESNIQKASFLLVLQKYNLKASYVDEQNKILKETSKAETYQLAQKYLDPGQMTILVVGDKEKIMPGLQKLGYHIVELDADGKMMQ